MSKIDRLMAAIGPGPWDKEEPWEAEYERKFADLTAAQQKMLEEIMVAVATVGLLMDTAPSEAVPVLDLVRGMLLAASSHGE